MSNHIFKAYYTGDFVTVKYWTRIGIITLPLIPDKSYYIALSYNGTLNKWTVEIWDKSGRNKRAKLYYNHYPIGKEWTVDVHILKLGCFAPAV